MDKKQTQIVAFIKRPNQEEDRREWLVIPHWRDAMDAIVRPILARGIELTIKEHENGCGARLMWKIDDASFAMFFSVEYVFTDVDIIRGVIDKWNHDALTREGK